MNKTTVMQKLFRLACEECGAALVEFAMSALILMALTFGVIGFGLAMYTYHFVSSAAQQGARFAMVRGYTWSKDETNSCSTSAPPSFTMVYECTASATDIQNYVQSLASGGINPSSVAAATTVANPSGMPDDTTTGCSASTPSQGCLVKVTVSYTFSFIPYTFNAGLFKRLSNLSMSATSEGEILQ